MKVLVLSAPVDPPLYVQREGRVITLGRDALSDVRLPDPTVSLRHASLKKRGDQWSISPTKRSSVTASVTSAGQNTSSRSSGPETRRSAGIGEPPGNGKP